MQERMISRRRAELEKLYRQSSQFDDDDKPSYSAEDEPATAKKNRHRWYSCRPAFVGCAVTCLLTVGVLKADGLLPWASPFLDRVGQPISSDTMAPAPTPVLAPQPVPAAVSAANMFSRVPGLSASRSTITGFTDAASMSAAYYWTFTLTNSGAAQQEAVMRIALPPGATVSRATLWVNGVAQEAAFSTNQQVTNAYEWVKNGRQPIRRLTPVCDPLVITQDGPGHILVKAAPVEAGGKELKLRIGFTAPLRPTSEHGSLQLPHIEESNFNISNLQDVHLESQTSVVGTGGSVSVVDNPAGGFLLKGNIRPEELGSLKIRVNTRTTDTIFATRATHSVPGEFIVAKLNRSAGGVSRMSLRKTSTLPQGCKVINSEPAAARISALWAHAEIESLVKRGEIWQANEIARVHRIVSSVSGATVLERDSDYTSMGLSRDLYATTALGRSTGGSTAGGAGDGMVAQNSRAMFSMPKAPTPQAASPPSFDKVQLAVPEMEATSIPGFAPDMAPRRKHRKSSATSQPTPMRPNMTAPRPVPMRYSRSRPVPTPSAENDVEIIFEDSAQESANSTTSETTWSDAETTSNLFLVGGALAVLLGAFYLLRSKLSGLQKKD